MTHPGHHCYSNLFHLCIGSYPLLSQLMSRREIPVMLKHKRVLASVVLLTEGLLLTLHNWPWLQSSSIYLMSLQQTTTKVHWIGNDQLPKAKKQYQIIATNCTKCLLKNCYLCFSLEERVKCLHLAQPIFIRLVGGVPSKMVY